MPSFKRKMTVSARYTAQLRCACCDVLAFSEESDAHEDGHHTPSAARQGLLKIVKEENWEFSEKNDGAVLCAHCYAAEAAEIDREEAAEIDRENEEASIPSTDEDDYEEDDYEDEEN